MTSFAAAQVRMVLTAGVLLLAACVSSQAEEEAPAIIIHATPQSRAELQQAVSTALQGVTVTLADDALTKTGNLFVERPLVRDPAGRPVNGRNLGRPEQFHLVKQGDRCVLVHENSGVRKVLPGTQCQVEVTK